MEPYSKGKRAKGVIPAVEKKGQIRDRGLRVAVSDAMAGTKLQGLSVPE